jgi:predicted RNase H-like HicB family nuclease
MNIKVLVHEAEEGGFWAEVPSIPGCASQGDSIDELVTNIREAIQGCLMVDVSNLTLSESDRLLEVAV